MSKDTQYKSISWDFRSKGVMARPATDRPPEEHFYLNMAGIYEREESALSTRYGLRIINRDPDGTPNGQNYPLPFAPVILSRLKSLGGLTFRYASLSDGSLWRRPSDTQGQYTQIISGLSGKKFTALTNTCFQSSQPYLFLYDSIRMLKDSGIGTPTGIGIFPPTVPITSTMYAPQAVMIEPFQSSAGFTTSGVSLVGISTVATVAGASGQSIPFGPYEQYTDNTLSYKTVPDGMIATSVNLADNFIRVKFNTISVNNTYDIVALNNAYQAADSFKFQAVTFSLAANSTGTVGKTANFNFSNYQSDDLIIIALQVSNPSAVQEIRVMFDINASGYGATYYYKSLIPVSYQGSVSLPQSNDPVSAMVSEVFNRAAGITNLAQMGRVQLLPPDDPSLPGIQPSQLSSGAGSWSIVYLRKGDFLPVGNAGQNGLDWSQVTGWKVQITTNSQGSTNVGFNALYIQGSPTASGVGTNAGPSSYGGIGYDVRYRYFNANTGTPSNPSRPQLYSTTQNNPGGTSTMVVFRQAINFQGVFSTDPQVTHVQFYVRGGVLGADWFYTDQIPNLPPGNVGNITQVLVISGGGPTISVVLTLAQAPLPAIVGTSVTISGLTVATFLNGATMVVSALNGNAITGTVTLTHSNYGPAQDFGIVTSPSGNYYPTSFNYQMILPDSARLQGEPLSVRGLTNDVPVTSTLQNPINTKLTGAVNPFPANTNAPTLATFFTGDSSVFLPNQLVVVGTPQNLEQVFVITGGVGQFNAFFVLPHAIGEQVQAFSTPAQPLNLAAVGYNQTWLAGDPNNPHFLYYTPVNYPENCPPQNYIPAPGGPGDPITAVINFQGTILVRTMSTWWKVFPGSPPYMQSTGSKHGSPASFDWSLSESEIWYQGWDGVRTFRGADGVYRSLIIEWIYRDNTLSGIPLVDTTKLNNVFGVFKNNTATLVYTGLDTLQHRIRYDTQYKRWRNDDVAATAAYVENDTNLELFSIPMTIGGNLGWFVVFATEPQDYDDGGWVGTPSALAKLPIPFTVQTPYFDQKLPNNQKQFNDLAIDCNPNGQVITVQLLFDDNNGAVPPLTLGTITGLIRAKFQLPVNAGFGQQAYRGSLVLSGSVTQAPIFYQADIHAAPLAEQKSTYDSYWIKFGTDENQLIKQGWFDYTSSNPIGVSLFADGNPNPYYTFTLPANPTRSAVPIRVRFFPMICRMFRMVMTTAPSGSFQLWAEPQIDQKLIIETGAKSYTRSEVSVGEATG